LNVVGFIEVVVCQKLNVYYIAVIQASWLTFGVHLADEMFRVFRMIRLNAVLSIASIQFCVTVCCCTVCILCLVEITELLRF